MLKTATFCFSKSGAIIATIGFSGPQTPDFQKQKVTCEKIGF